MSECVADVREGCFKISRFIPLPLFNIDKDELERSFSMKPMGQPEWAAFGQHKDGHTEQNQTTTFPLSRPCLPTSNKRRAPEMRAPDGKLDWPGEDF